MQRGKPQRKHLGAGSAGALIPDAHVADLVRLVTAQKGLQAALDNADENDDQTYDRALKSWVLPSRCL
ncbi:MAG: hypothetical protein M1840_001710 [Geoglossum simile]|nr:MAG: hypothetical protein M1840_001710 [Geoglossum simile]